MKTIILFFIIICAIGISAIPVLSQAVVYTKVLQTTETTNVNFWDSIFNSGIMYLQFLTPFSFGNTSVTLNNVTNITIGQNGTAITQIRVYTPTIDITTVGVSSSSEQTFNITGLSLNDTVYGNKPSHTSGCVIGNLRVSAPNVLAITIGNVNSVLGACDPPSETWRIVAIRS